MVKYWRTAFDWRAEETRLNTFPQYKAPLRGIDPHFLHLPGQGPAPSPLLRLLASEVREFCRPLRERRSA